MLQATLCFEPALTTLSVLSCFLRKITSFENLESQETCGNKQQQGHDQQDPSPSLWAPLHQTFNLPAHLDLGLLQDGSTASSTENNHHCKQRTWCMSACACQLLFLDMLCCCCCALHFMPLSSAADMELLHETKTWTGEPIPVWKLGREIL